MTNHYQTQIYSGSRKPKRKCAGGNKFIKITKLQSNHLIHPLKGTVIINFMLALGIQEYNGRFLQTKDSRRGGYI